MWALPTLLSLGAIYIFWGTSYLVIKTAGQEIQPWLLTGLRNLAAGAVLLGVACLLGRRLGSWLAWRNAAVVGVLMIGVGAGLLARGLHDVPSGAGAVLFAAVPLCVCILMAVLSQRISRAQLAGTLLGMLGVVLLGADSLDSTGLQGPTLILLAVVATSLSAVISDRLPMPEDVLMSAAVQMIAGGAVATLVGFALGERLGVPSARTWAALAYLSLFVSIIGYMSYVYLIRHAGPVMASSYAYVNPPVALLVGAVVLDEVVSTQAIVASGVVMAGAVTVLLAAPSRAAPAVVASGLARAR